MWLAAISAALAGYPPGIVAECVDPRVGLARTREFAPTVAAVVEWCDRRSTYYRQWARYVAVRKTRDEILPATPVSPGMKARITQLFADLVGSLRVAAKTPR